MTDPLFKFLQHSPQICATITTNWRRIGYTLYFEDDHANVLRDILHPGRANIAKDELRDKLAALYKATKDQVNVFGLRTQFGGGKTTGFALVYDSPEAMKKFEPHYRLVRVGLATKIEKAGRQQRKQRKNRQKTLRGTAKVKGVKAKKEK